MLALKDVRAIPAEPVRGVDVGAGVDERGAELVIVAARGIPERRFSVLLFNI